MARDAPPNDSSVVSIPVELQQQYLPELYYKCELTATKFVLQLKGLV